MKRLMLLTLFASAGCRPDITTTRSDVEPHSPAAASEKTSPVRDIGNEVRKVFAEKCAGCHGSDLAKPKGRFGYVLDLERVAKNTEMVIPTQPSESELYILVEREEMPPPDSSKSPLTAAQKELVKEWIKAGAPAARQSSTE